MQETPPAGKSTSSSDSSKLIPEWSKSGDDQIIWVGLAVLLLVLGGLGVKSCAFGGDAADKPAVTTPGAPAATSDLTPDVAAAVAAYTGVTGVADGDVAELTGFVDSAAQSDEAEAAAAAVKGIKSVDNQLVALQPEVRTTLTEAGVKDATADVDGLVATVYGLAPDVATAKKAYDAAAAVPGVTDVINKMTIADPEPDTSGESATEAPATGDLTGDVAAAVAEYKGVVGVADGDVAKLTGFVDTDDQSALAAQAAGEVTGIKSVDNQLVALQPSVLAALTGAGVTNPAAEVNGLVATAKGQVADEPARATALAAAAAVPGVDSVVDQLTVAAVAATVPAAPAGDPLANELNALVEAEPIQFASGSAEILPASFATLDKAAAIIANTPSTKHIEVQGFTDIRGNAANNQTLSESRAGAVALYLISKGVPADRLSSSGQGPTDKFDAGTTPEAYALNRRVLFVVS